MKENLNNKYNLIHKIKLLLLFFSLFALTANITAASGPVISFSEESWDFGEITPDELPTHIFKLENIGDEVLIIKEAKVSCESCIDPLISTKELNPGDSAELKITVNSLDMIGRFTKRIYVESNDPVNPRVVVTVSGFIKEKEKNESVESVVQNQPQLKPQAQPQPQAPFQVGKSYFSKGEYDEAIIEFEKSIELNPDHAESYFYLGRCYLLKGNIEYNKNIFKANSFYRKANEISEQAIPKYKKIIEDNPEDLNSYLRLGYIYEVKSMLPFINEYDKALEYYLKALALDAVSESKNKGIYVYLNTRAGSVYYQMKDYLQAIEYLEMTEKISPRNVEVAYYLGLSYDKIGETEKAQEFLSRVLELAPQSEYAQEAEKELKKME